MSDKETATCWACNEVVPKTAAICPNCDMPLKDSSDEIEDIDSFLDDLDTKSSETESPAIPEFTEEMPEIPDFATETLDDENLPIDVDAQVDDQMEIESIKKVKPIADEKEPAKSLKIDATVIEEGFPDIPTFNEMDFDEGEEKETIVSEIRDTVSLLSLTTKQKLRIFLPQLTYWSIVFIIISFASLTITNSNFTLDVFASNDYTIGTELFLFGWFSFIPMGWFYRYKLNQYRVKDSMMYGLLYIILQLLYLGITTIIFFLIINPDAKLATITDSDTAITTIMSTYVYFSFLGFLISGLTLGFVLFFVGYRFYFKQIYEITPASKLSN